MKTQESQASSQEYMSDWFQKTAELTEAALRATAQMQLVGLDQFMESMLGAAGAAQEAQKIPERTLKQIPAAQKSAREYMKAVDEIHRNGLRLMNDIIKGGRSKNAADLHKRFRREWREMLQQLRSSSEEFMKASNQAMDAWAKVASKAAE
jgi:hypothetical protein